MSFIIFAMSFLWSKEAMVFDVRKNLPLADGQKIYHDYYINAGSQDGLKNKMHITVTRKMPFRDTNLSKIEEDLVVDIATLELIHVQKTFSVARLKEIKKGPVLEYNTVMIGDRLDIKTARMPSSMKEKEVKKVSAVSLKKQTTKKKIAALVKPKAEKKIKANKDPKIRPESIKMSGEVPQAN